ncbi:hypothetical protein GGR92_002818 [Spirosoma lacussanchae]|uniref:hypothetical protein n=1 Tax=Spirosoma lacussanchae TaxID=1884249 RepID=UPI001109AADE|nr:hypothetical protein [Spirosoma lacussanchae]
MSTASRHIYLSWRKGRSSRRHIVGLLTDSYDNQVRFSYLQDGVNGAKQDGFQGYTEFKDYTKEYKHNVLEVFAQRLTPAVRLKSSHTSIFWAIPEDKILDTWSILAYTQGLLSTDNFELLADFEPYKGLSFISDLAGLSHIEIPINLLNVGDVLRWEFDLENKFDDKAISVYKSNTKIGYIKKVHCNLFHKWDSRNIEISTHAIEKNGSIKNVFIKIHLA